MARSMEEYARDWQNNAEADAFWSILTNPKFSGKKWDRHAFLKTGEEEIARLIEYMEKKSIRVPQGRFMDFGCGVGRVSGALRKHFSGGCGVDISPAMIGLAREFVEDVHFLVNQKDSLEYFEDESVDFVYSHIVLQHIPVEYQKRYIAEFLRILVRGGLAVFQVPIEFVEAPSVKRPLTVRLRDKLKECFPALVALKRKFTPSSTTHSFQIEMHSLPFEEVKACCDAMGCIIEASPATNSCERDHNGAIEFHVLGNERKLLENSNRENRYLSCMFFVRKPI